MINIKSDGVIWEPGETGLTARTQRESAYESKMHCSIWNYNLVLTNLILYLYN